MTEQPSRIQWPQGLSRRPDGVSGSLPLGPIGIGGTYYFNPGSPTAPKTTVTGGVGMGGGGAHAVFLRDGMSSDDTLGYGATLNVAPTIFPSVTVNGSIPDQSNIPQPWKAKISSIEAGAGLPGFAGTYTWTPAQIADWINTHIFSSGMGPQDELSPFVRSLQSKNGSVGANSKPAVPFLNPQEQGPVGTGMADWSASARRPNAFESGASAVPYFSVPQQGAGGLPGLLARVAGTDPLNPAQPAPPAGGLLGLMQDYMRNNPDGGTR